jgi:hypothetical protein
MNQENNIPNSINSLVNASLFAVLLALVVLFTAVLPAEYGIDPTGIGKKLGLTVLAESAKASVGNCATVQTDAIANNPAATPAKLTALDESVPITWQDTVEIQIPPQKGLEYKFKMAAGNTLEFAWFSQDGSSLYYDFHGEPDGAKDGYFESYEERQAISAKGRLLTPFAGVHGWYWENKSDKPVVVKLHSKGTYQIVGIINNG